MNFKLKQLSSIFLYLPNVLISVALFEHYPISASNFRYLEHVIIHLAIARSTFSLVILDRKNHLYPHYQYDLTE